MISPAQLHAAIMALAPVQTIGREADVPAERTFTLDARNDFLTPRGVVFKWQEVRARISRAVTGEPSAGYVPMRYTWQFVDSRAGRHDSAANRREWTFARGQQFVAALPVRAPNGTTGPDAPWQPDALLNVNYPELPPLPAVDLLLMLSWDVLTFEALCSEFTADAELGSTGTVAHLDRVSQARAHLRFSHPAATGTFRNGRMSATLLGYGLFVDRPVAVHSFQCLDCDLVSRYGPVTQRGRSSYSGTLLIDAATADLVGGEFIETIVATVAGADGRQVPTYKRRLVRLRLAAVVGVATGDDTEADCTGAVGDAGGAGRTDDQVLLRGAADLADRMVHHLRAEISWLAYLPAHLEPLAHEGFRTLVGSDRSAVLRRLAALRRNLAAWATGDGAAANAARTILPECGRELGGLAGYGTVATETMEQLELGKDAALGAIHSRLAALRDDATALLATLGDLPGSQ